MALEERLSVCTFDCPDTCSLSVGVDDGHIVKVRGSDAVPYTAGVICNKVARYTGDFVHGPQRLLHPLRRTGPKGSGEFARISWDVALDEIFERVSAVIDRWGPQAVMPLNYAGPHGFLAGDSMSLRFFHRLGATQLYRRALCGGVRSEAWAGTYGAVPGCPPEFAEHAKLNVVWGNNATATNLHLVRGIRRAKRAGGRLVVVDPLRTQIAEQADLHLQLLPGTDVLLAWSLAAELERSGSLDDAFIAAQILGAEEFMARAREWPAARAAAVCGLEESQILAFADWLAEAEPLVLAPGNGLERGRNGGSGVRAAIALPALLGKLGKGNGIVLAAGNAFPKTPARLQRPDLLPAGTRTLNINNIGRHLAEDDIDPPLRALFIYNHNPIVVHPDQNRMRRGLAGGDPFRIRRALCFLRSSLAAARRAGDPSARRVIAEHGDLPPPRCALRLHRAVLRGYRCGIDGRCDRWGRSATRRHPAERDRDPPGRANGGARRKASFLARQCLSRDTVRQDRAQIRGVGRAMGRRGRAAGMAPPARPYPACGGG